jgi:uncharacterized protein YwgA
MANEISVRDVVLLAYKAFDGCMRGKTLLQKRVYFLSVILQLDLGYEAHYYGPYSEEVATANAEIKSLGFISESVTSWGIDRRGFELARYDYRLSDVGSRIADKKALACSDLWRKIQDAAGIVKHAGDLDYMELSIAAKAYFILRQLNRKATIDDIAAMLPKFSWSVTREELQKAAGFLVKAQLVSQA